MIFFHPRNTHPTPPSIAAASQSVRTPIGRFGFMPSDLLANFARNVCHITSPNPLRGHKSQCCSLDSVHGFALFFEHTPPRIDARHALIVVVHLRRALCASMAQKSHKGGAIEVWFPMRLRRLGQRASKAGVGIDCGSHGRRCGVAVGAIRLCLRMRGAPWGLGRALEMARIGRCAPAG